MSDEQTARIRELEERMHERDLVTIDQALDAVAYAIDALIAERQVLDYDTVVVAHTPRRLRVELCAAVAERLKEVERE